MIKPRDHRAKNKLDSYKDSLYLKRRLHKSICVRYSAYLEECPDISSQDIHRSNVYYRLKNNHNPLHYSWYAQVNRNKYK